MTHFPSSLVLRLMLRDLRGGLSGFVVFLACIAIGVAAIVGVGSSARALSTGLQREGRVILGGDVSFGLIHREIGADERAYLEQLGKLTAVALLRAMARPEAGDPTLVEVKAVEPADHPAIGALVAEPAQPLTQALAHSDEGYGVIADAELIDRFGLKPGDRFKLGEAQLVLRGRVVSEPDRLAGGVSFGPRALISQEALRATGLIQPGSLIRWLYRLALPAPIDEAGLAAIADRAAARFPQAGWETRTRAAISPQFNKSLDRFTQFLQLIGLTSLIVGGVGVANAVGGFVELKRGTIATLKSLGAPGPFVFLLMLAETVLVAGLGIAVGVALGAALPFAVRFFFGALIPFPFEPGIFPRELASGALYGLFATLAFALTPLGAAHDVPASTLFRAIAGAPPTRTRCIYRLAAAAAAAALAALVLALAPDARLSLAFMLATLAALLALRGLAFLVVRLARALPPAPAAIWRLAIANIHRPGAPTASVVLSLGLGVTLLVALAGVDGNLRAELDRTRGPDAGTPSFFFVDIQSSQAADFDAFLRERIGPGKLDEAPMMRGRLVKIRDIPVERIKAKENVAWVLEGDRGLTFAPALPEGSQLMTGDWWPADYSGPPLVSMEAEVADGLGLKLGDAITVNVLGRNLTATIANLRKVNWRSFGINFVMVFSPNAFAGAPHARLATVTFPQGADDARERALLHDVARAFPTITGVRVKDTLDTLAKLLGQLTLAIRAASGVALVSAVLVLAGALASGRRARLYDAVVLKTLGMTRWRLAQAYAIEYSSLGLVTAVFGIAAGMAAARAVVVGVMGLDFIWLWREASLAAGLSTLITLGLGFAGSWRILSRRPAAGLRAFE